jgi:hypothetical protein
VKEKDRVRERVTEREITRGPKIHGSTPVGLEPISGGYEQKSDEIPGGLFVGHHWQSWVNSGGNSGDFSVVS